MRLSTLSLACALLLSACIVAQNAPAGEPIGVPFTITLPWADGNTLVEELSTDGLGDTFTLTLSTVTPGAAGAAVGAAKSKSSSSSSTTTPTLTPTTPTQRVVGNTPATDGPPPRTITYGYPDADGQWVTATWTATVTSAPTVASGNVPAGTIQSYASYETSENSILFNSATASGGVVSDGVSGAFLSADAAGAVWLAIGAGVVGTLWAATQL